MLWKGSKRLGALSKLRWKDPEFKKPVISNPKEMLERHTGKKLPPEVNIFIHEEDANTLHFSIPPAPGNLAELSDEELERVANGTDLVAAAVVVSSGLDISLVSTVGVTVAKEGW
jgi:hypothetical protein